MFGAKRIWTVVLIAAGLAAFGWQANLYSGPMLNDDAFISFRYAANLADGQGLVFNPGERVEGFTNLLWVLVLAAVRRLGGDIPTAAHLLGLVLGGATIVLAAAWPRRLAAAVGADEIAAGAWGGVAALLLGLSHPFAYHASIGLETPLMAAALSAGLLTLRPANGRPGWISCGFFLVAMLTRPEGLALFGFVVAAFLARSALARSSHHLATAARDMPRSVAFSRIGLLDVLSSTPPRPSGRKHHISQHLARLATRRGEKSGLIHCWHVVGLGPIVTTGAVYALFLAWRLAYYGEIVPNTYFAKRAALLTDLGSGLDYLGSYLLGGHGAVAAAALVVLGLHLGWAAVMRWPLPLLAGHALMVVFTGGDFFWFWRFFAPLVPLVAALATVALSVVWKGSGSRVHRAASLAAAVLTGVGLLLPGLARADLVRSTYDAHEGKWIMIGERLAQAVAPGSWIALSPVGAIPYYSGLPTIDILGLTDRHIARVPADPEVRRKAHQKHDGAYVLSRRPDLLVLGNGLVVTASIDAPDRLEWYPELAVDEDGAITRGTVVDWYRQGRGLTYEADIFHHPDFRRCYRPVLLPLVDDLRLLAWQRIDECPR